MSESLKIHYTSKVPCGSQFVCAISMEIITILCLIYILQTPRDTHALFKCLASQRIANSQANLQKQL